MITHIYVLKQLYMCVCVCVCVNNIFQALEIPLGPLPSVFVLSHLLEYVVKL